jgi:endonuclease/exonuclease/phosphatase family metal-dependent hydrolase
MAAALLFRVATYNVHGCVGRSGLDVGRGAEVVASLECDVVALQELDVHRPRSGNVDQAAEIAARLGASVAFGLACDFGDGGHYGNAVLSRWPIDRAHTHALPVSRGLRCEPRSLVAATVETPRGPLRAWCTHLGVRGHEREAQGHTLLSHVASALGESGAPMVLLGDLNAGVETPLVRELATHLVDVRRRTSARTATFPAILPMFSLDHAFVSSPLVVRDVRVVRSSIAAAASDHLPLVVTLEWPAPAPRGA